MGIKEKQRCRERELIFFLNRRERKPSSMTTPISRPTTVRRPWIEYLKQNRERWIREAGKSRTNQSFETFFLNFFQTKKNVEKN